MDLKHYRHPNLFYFASIAIPWIVWLVISNVSFSNPNQFDVFTRYGGFLGLFAPLVVAMAIILTSKPLRKDIAGRLFNLQTVNSKYLSFTFLLMPFSILTAQLISLFFGYSTDQFQFRNHFAETPGSFPAWFVFIIAPLAEELAWHSYGTDSLRNRFSLLNASILFALLWGLWYIPLSFIQDFYHSNTESQLLYFINFFASQFPFVIFINWLYYKTDRNILITIVFHISATYFNEIFATHPMSKVIQTALLTLLSIYLIINEKSYFINY